MTSQTLRQPCRSDPARALWVCVCLSMLSCLGCDSLSPIEGVGSSNSVEGTPKLSGGISNANPETYPSDLLFGKWIGPPRSMESKFLRSPRLESLDFPGFPGANAIWGATGRDSNGRIYFGWHPLVMMN